MTFSRSSSTPNTRWNGWRRKDRGILITISLCRWRKGLSAAHIVFSNSPFWVQVWGVPFELMTEDTRRDIGNRIGNFLKADRRS